MFDKIWIYYFSTNYQYSTQTTELKSIRHFLTRHQVWYFLSKNIKVSQWLLKGKFLYFITTVNASSRNETESDIFSWDIFKFDIIFHWSQNTTKIFQWLW